MTIVYIPVEVPGDDLSALLLKLGGVNPSLVPQAQPAGDPFSPPYEQPAPQQAAPVQDPWNGQPTQQQPPPPQVPQQPQVPQAPQGSAPSCTHGQMRYVPAGYSKSTGKAYAAFYGCPAPRGETQCRSVRA